MQKLPPKEIFRAYDIRGIAGTQITEETAFSIARAFAELLKAAGQKKACVGRDARPTGEAFEKAVIEALIQSGIEVIELGVIPTPILYFATWRLDTPNGIMVTASHNPSEYNGFKFVLNRNSLTETEIKNLYDRICDPQPLEKIPPAACHHQDISEDYIQYVCAQIALKKPLKVVVDAGNGMAGELAPKLYRAMGCEVIELYCELDGRFPNHHPDPSRPNNLVDLQKAVVQHQADIGLAFDGDADRLGAVTNAAEIIWPDRQMMIFSEAVLQEKPGANIIFDVKCSKYVPEIIAKNGGVPMMWKTGHSLVKLKVKEVGAALGGEMSGHIFFNDRWFGYDDGIYAGARLLEILSRMQKTASELFTALPESVSTHELNVAVPEAQKFEVVHQLIEKAKPLAADKNLLDGLRITFKDGWALVRASNTSPMLTLRFEADDQAAFERIQSTIRALLLEVVPNAELPF